MKCFLARFAHCCPTLRQNVKRKKKNNICPHGVCAMHSQTPNTTRSLPALCLPLPLAISMPICIRNNYICIHLMSELLLISLYNVNFISFGRCRRERDRWRAGARERKYIFSTLIVHVAYNFHNDDYRLRVQCRKKKCSFWSHSA